MKTRTFFSISTALALATGVWIFLVEGMTRNASLGYPAGEEHLQDDTVYWVNVSAVDAWPDRTNNLAVMNSVKIASSADYHHSREPRLFRLSKPLDRGYYRVTRSGTNMSYELIPGPVRPQ